MLPKLPYGANIRRQLQTAFGGMDHNGVNGAVADMLNLSSDHEPLLGTREGRYILPSLSKANGIYAHNGLFTVDGTSLKLDGVEVGSVEDSEKTFCSLGDRVVIFPDKVCYHMTEQTLTGLEAGWSGTMTFQDGTYADEEAELNTIVGDTAFPFNVRDAVTISGCAPTGGEDLTIIIREISEDKKTLRFYENSFLEAGTYTGSIRRTVPDLDYFCENENRIWGCKGDTIWCCKLGDPFNWNVFDGISTDAWSVDVGSAGDFTGCVSYLGYPCFFKGEKIYKVYGDRATNFQVMGSATLGCIDHKSFAVAGEVLYYLSRAGVVAYSGGIPQCIGEPLGVKPTHGVGGSDGVKYYLNVDEVLYVYDTQRGVWHKEGCPALVGAAWQNGLHLLGEDGQMLVIGAPAAPDGAAEETDIESWARFGDYEWDSPDYKNPIRLLVRMSLEDNTSVSIDIRYDGGEWNTAATMNAQVKRSWEFPVPIRRCDHYAIRVSGTGKWRVHCLGHEYYSTSARKER